MTAGWRQLFVKTIVCCMLCTKSGLAAFPSEEQMETLFTNYNAKIPPTDDGRAVQDNLQMYILSIDSISDSSMDYAMSFYLRQRWKDPRLSFNFSGVDVIEIDTKMMGSIWVPDVYIVNEKKANFHDITVPNRLINISPNGELFYSVRLSGTFSCRMNLLKYPLDRQKCIIKFESYAYSAKTVVVRWQSKAAELAPDLTLPQFNLMKQSPFLCDGLYAGVNYTCVGLTFYLERSKGYYITQIYIPSILIVILSWVNFWLSVDAVPARISLGLLTILTMTTQTATALSNLQKVSYVKAMDVWLATCLTFVFAALIEFAYVNVTARVELRRRQSYSASSSSTLDEINDNDLGKEKDMKKKKTENKNKTREKARTIDRVSRILFPVVFLVFNIAYWTIYLVWEPVEF